ncbi:MAG TPA: signal peptidase II [Firmicutes bacterium]|nr:signal peptidase II [Bacillota bacterium]
MRRSLVATAIIVLLIYLADQLSKFLIAGKMELYESIPIINNFFYLTLIPNTGGAFGLLANRTAFFIVVPALIILLLIICFKFIPAELHYLRLGLTLQLGGALGNLTDRLRLGHVLDFLDFRVWPIFNVADMALVIGAFFLALELFKLSYNKKAG